MTTAIGTAPLDASSLHQVRIHVKQVCAQGLSPQEVARRARIDVRIILALLRQSAPPAMGGGHARALLAVGRPSGPTIVDRPTPTALGTRRRLQALIAFGHDSAGLAERIGIAADELDTIVRADTAEIDPRLIASVTNLFDWLQMVPGRSESARAQGRSHHWPLPFDWNEDQIDDPDYQETRSADSTQTLQARRDVQTSRRAKVEELTRASWSIRAIAEKLGVTQRTVQRDRAALKSAAAYDTDIPATDIPDTAAQTADPTPTPTNPDEVQRCETRASEDRRDRRSIKQRNTNQMAARADDAVHLSSRHRFTTPDGRRRRRIHCAPGRHRQRPAELQRRLIRGAAAGLDPPRHRPRANTRPDSCRRSESGDQCHV